MSLFYRYLGQTEIRVSGLGLGCWAIGGPYQRNGKPMGWGRVDDNESERAIRLALDHGINFFDTADLYGCGHSETILGSALRENRPDVDVASKFGYRIDAKQKTCTGTITLPDDIETALDSSLRRLRTDYLDLYQLHIQNCPDPLAADVQDRLETLTGKGKIRAYGWSTDKKQAVSAFVPSPRFVSIQQALNVIQGNHDLLKAAESSGLTIFCRSPLAMGLLTEKWCERRDIAADDLRSRWNLDVGDVPAMLDTIGKIRGILTADGRSLTQGALAWIWGISERTIPIPGFRDSKQVLENALALDKGPLTAEQMSTIDELVFRAFPHNPWNLVDA